MRASSRKLHRRFALFACGGQLCLLVASPVTSVAAPIATERQLGEEFVIEARKQIPLIDDYEINSFVRSVGSRFVAKLGTQPFDYEFFVVNDGSINAFAVPGGKIFINAGLISRADNEAELAGVIGHEIAHAHAHHSVRQQEKSAAANYAGLLGMFLTLVNPVLGQAAVSAAVGQQLKYQRDFEREADFLGIDLAKQAGYDPSAMLGLLRKIYDEQKVNPTAIPPYFLSHPLTGERMTYLESALGTKEWEVDRASADWEFSRVQAIARGNCQTRRQAVPPYERMLSSADKSTRPGALELIGVLMTHGEDYQAAIPYLEEAARDGRNVDRELGRAYLRTGRLKDAGARLGRVIAANPQDWSALADMGETHYQEGAFAPAAELLERSYTLYPYTPSLMETLARAMDKIGRRGAGFYYLAAAAEFRGDSTQAATYYAKAAETIPASDPLKATVDEKLAALEKEKPRVPPSHQRGPKAPRP